MKKQAVFFRPLVAEILTIGDELLKGSTINSNAAFLGKALREDGFVVRRQTACPDRIPEIQSCLREALARADLVLLTGGLGPTPDDVTRQAVAGCFELPLIFSKSQYRLIQALYRRHGRRIPSLVRCEAMFPETSAPLLNRYGIALGFTITVGPKRVVVLPGVPQELENMYRGRVRPLLRKAFPGGRAQASLTVKTAGISEPEVMRRLGKDFFDEEFEFGIYPSPGEVALRLGGENRALMKRLKSKIRARLGKDVYAWEEQSLAGAVGDILARRGKTLSVAESCTGGLLASEVTVYPGASRYFLGGITAYTNRLKTEWLGVSPELLRVQGAVSEPVALKMAEGIRQRTGADYALSVTGIAGPSGGSKSKPVGTVVMACVSKRSRRVVRKLFWGTRSQVQIKAVRKALEMLWRVLRGPR